MSLNFLVMADDFSGAAEIAGAVWRFGHVAQVHLDLPRTNSHADCRALVIDADSRSLSCSEAADAVKRVANKLGDFSYQSFYKKIDSALRGWVAEEISALRSALGLKHALLVNANPRKQRIVVDGQLLIHGIPIHRTQFADDPEHPIRDACVDQILTHNHDRLRIVSSVAQLKAEFDRTGSTTIFIANCQSTAELLAYAEFFLSRRGELLLAGAAEMFEACWSVQNAEPALCDYSPMPPLARVLLVQGSASPTPAIALPDMLRVEVNDTPQQSAREVVRLMENDHSIWLAASSRDSAVPSMGGATEMHERLVRTVELLLKQSRPEQLLIAGGHTASSIVRALGWHCLTVHGVYADGVVGLTVDNAQAPPVIVKPGSYPWPATG